MLRVTTVTALLLAGNALAQERPAAAPSLWSFHGSAVAEDSADPAAWLRLTPNETNKVGMALSRQGDFDVRRGVTLSFSYAAWGGGTPSGDGISVFLYDPTKGMTGAESGAGLGYCGAPGGWLAVGLDEYGNFSHPLNQCRNGPGPKPSLLVLRGPTANGAAYVAAAPVPGGVDRPQATQRSGTADVTMYLWPKASGFTVAVDWRPQGAVEWRSLVERADFPFAAPPVLGLGAAAGTGLAKNVHEVGRMRARLHGGIPAALKFEPAATTAGVPSTVTLDLGLGSRAAAILVRPLQLDLPAGVEVANPPNLGGNCAATVRAMPEGRSITLERGSVIRTGGCTVSANVVARAAGTYPAALPAGSLLSDAGTNPAPAAATLTVAR